MNWKIVSIVLVVLLVGTSGVTIYQYSQNQQLSSENKKLRADLDMQSQRMSDLESEKRDLEVRLNQMVEEVNQLEEDVRFLKKQISDLQEELGDLRRREGAITIGLTFLWNRNLGKLQTSFTDSGDLGKTIFALNQIWDSMDTYFFLYHNAVWDTIPDVVDYSDQFCELLGEARNLFLGNDVPVIVVNEILPSGGVDPSGVACLWTKPEWSIIVVEERSLTANVLTHEILHVFGFTDKQMIEKMNYVSDWIPIEWLTQIRARAKLFQMPIP